MNLNEYQDLAARTINRNRSSIEILHHSLFGLCSEVGEIHSLFQKSFQGHEIDSLKLREEIGDVMWMVAELCTINGWSMSDICYENIKKLEARYPEGFSEERSVNRNKYEL